jgi:hypothetical protein
MPYRMMSYSSAQIRIVIRIKEYCEGLGRFRTL